MAKFSGIQAVHLPKMRGLKGTTQGWTSEPDVEEETSKEDALVTVGGRA